MNPAEHIPAPFVRPFTPTVHCDLCGETMAEDPDVTDATGLNICPLCIEEELNAPRS